MTKSLNVTCQNRSYAIRKIMDLAGGVQICIKTNQGEIMYLLTDPSIPVSESQVSNSPPSGGVTSFFLVCPIYIEFYLHSCFATDFFDYILYKTECGVQTRNVYYLLATAVLIVCQKSHIYVNSFNNPILLIPQLKYTIQ